MQQTWTVVFFQQPVVGGFQVPDPRKKRKKRKKGKKEKKKRKKEFKEVLKSHDLDNVFEIQVGGKMRIF